MSEAVENILDQLFTNGSGQKADRLLLITEDRSGVAKVSDAQYLGGFSRLAVRDIVTAALEAATKEKDAEIEKLKARRVHLLPLPS